VSILLLLLISATIIHEFWHAQWFFFSFIATSNMLSRKIYFLTFKSSYTSSSHFILGLPLGVNATGFHSVIFSVSPCSSSPSTCSNNAKCLDSRHNWLLTCVQWLRLGHDLSCNCLHCTLWVMKRSKTVIMNASFNVLYMLILPFTFTFLTCYGLGSFPWHSTFRNERVGSILTTENMMYLVGLVSWYT
jgi:hypothetical protein